MAKMISEGISSEGDGNKKETINMHVASLLYYGLVRIFSRKTKLLYEEIRDFQTRVTMVWIIFDL